MYGLGMTILESDRFITREESTWTPPSAPTVTAAPTAASSELPLVPLAILAAVVLLIGRGGNRR